MKDWYKLKEEIERLIYEGHLKKYVKDEFSHGSNKLSLWGWDDIGNPKPKKLKEASHGKGSKMLCRTLYTV